MKVTALLCSFALGFSVHAVAEEFNPLHHSGPASPYFDAPPEAGIPKQTPGECIVDQAAYILRHGS